MPGLGLAVLTAGAALISGAVPALAQEKKPGLSLAAIPGTPNTLSARAYTMGQLFKDAGYATAIFGKWHLGIDPQSLPGAHGFDEFYGIPPDTSWNDAATVSLIMQSHSIDAPEKYLIEKGPWMMRQMGVGPLERVKPFTPEVRAEVDNELTDLSIAFIKQQQAAGKPFFLYLPFSMGHVPNYPSKQCAGKSRIGQYGDKIMEGDYHVGQVHSAPVHHAAVSHDLRPEQRSARGLQPVLYRHDLWLDAGAGSQSHRRI